MYPILFQFGSIAVASWHLCLMVAVFSGWILFRKLATRFQPQLKAWEVDRIFIGAYIFGYLGSRILSIYLEEEYQDPGFKILVSLFFPGSMTLYGGLLAGATWLVLSSRKHSINICEMGDLVIPPVLFGIGLGRIGCFLNGDDFGIPVDSSVGSLAPWWVVRFDNLQDGLYRYPVQIFETIICWCLAFLLFQLIKSKNVRPGRVADIGIFGYAISRFFLEYLRGDSRGALFFEGVSPAQVISVAIVIIWFFYRVFGHMFRKINEVSS